MTGAATSASQSASSKADTKAGVQEELPYVSVSDVSTGYAVNERGQTIRFEKDENGDVSKRVVIEGWIVVKEIQHNYKTNSYTYVLIGKDIQGKVFEISVPADTFYGMQYKLKAVIAPHFDLKTKFNLTKKDNLQGIIAATTKNVKQITEYNQVTWVGDKLIVPGLEPEGFKCQLDKSWFPYRMSPDLELESALGIYDTILDSAPIENVMPLIILTFISPVVGKLFPDYRYGYALIGETGSLKTATSRTLLSIYGTDFKHGNTLIKLGEGSTNNAAGEIAAMAGVMPVLLDNFKPYADFDKSKLSAMINTIMEGASKARGKKDGGLQDTKKYMCCLIITGEDYSLESASLARVMQCEWIKPDTSKLFKIGDPRLDHMPAVGYSWLTWLQTEDGIAAMKEFQVRFPEERRKYAEEMTKKGAPNPERLGSNMAMESLGLELMCKHPVFGPYFDKFRESFRENVSKKNVLVADSVRSGSEAEELVELLKEKIARGIFILDPLREVKYPNVRAGWEDDEYYYIYPSEIKKLLKELAGAQKLGLPQIGNQLKSRGYIIASEEGKNQRLEHKPDGKTLRVYVFPKSKINESDDRKSHGDDEKGTESCSKEPQWEWDSRPTAAVLRANAM